MSLRLQFARAWAARSVGRWLCGGGLVMAFGCPPNEANTSLPETSSTGGESTGEQTSVDPTEQTGIMTSTVGMSATESTVTMATMDPDTDTNPTTDDTEEPSVCPASCLTPITYDCTDQDCNDPCTGFEYDCGFDEVCALLTIARTEGSEDYAELDEKGATCVFEALRDRTNGRLTLRWGDPQGFNGDDAIAIHATIDILGDDTVLMTWKWEYTTCCTGQTAVSQRVELQPPDFFTACLNEATVAGKIQCLTAGSTAAMPAPPGWLPPWTLGTCDTRLAAACP